MGRVASGSGADSMLQFQLAKGDDRMKHYPKMKQRQQVHHCSMRRKHDMVRWCDGIDWMRGDTGEGKERRRYQLC
jgi:hypothetical protein